VVAAVRGVVAVFAVADVAGEVPEVDVVPEAGAAAGA
jgi:hypothetical protein